MPDGQEPNRGNSVLGELANNSEDLLDRDYRVHPAVVVEGAHSLFHEGGTAIVIHASPDDNVTDPAGNAGARIACGVITK